jgi:dTDP-4-amino-4,6-dideoxygalactose transaminase
LYECHNTADAARACARLHRARIGYRLWYGEGVARQTYYADLPRDRLDVTEQLAPCLLGLPMAPDLADAAIIEVGAALRDAA